MRGTPVLFASILSAQLTLAAGAFGRGVVLPDDRSEPVDQRALGRDRTRRRAVHDVTERGQVVAAARLRRQAQQTMKHRRDHVRVRDAVALDQLERALGR